MMNGGPSFITSPLAIAVNYFVVDVKALTPNKLTLLSFIVCYPIGDFYTHRWNGHFYYCSGLNPVEPCTGLYGWTNGAL